MIASDFSNWAFVTGSAPLDVLVSSGCFWQPVIEMVRSRADSICVFMVWLCCFTIQTIYKLKKSKTVKITFKLLIEYDEDFKMVLKFF